MISHSKLTRHLSGVHKDNPDVRSALDKPRRQRVKIFKSFRKQGMHDFNLKQINSGENHFLPERKPKSDKIMQRNLVQGVVCSKCKGLYSKGYKFRHQLICGQDSCVLPVSVSVANMANPLLKNVNSKFKAEVLNGLRNDEIGRLVKEDQTILTIGEWLFSGVKSRRDKKQDVYDSVRSAMRRLGHLYNPFKKRKEEISFFSSSDQNNSTNMFLRENFEIFKWAVELYTSSDKEESKSGLKAGLYYLIKDAAEKCMCVYLGENNDDSAEKVWKYMALLKLKKDEIFADSTYNLNKRRKVKNRKPSELHGEDDILTIKKYVIKRMGEITNDPFLLIDMYLYVELRDFTNTRLIIFNGRRGGEPSRPTISEWKEAKNDV